VNGRRMIRHNRRLALLQRLEPPFNPRKRFVEEALDDAEDFRAEFLAVKHPRTPWRSHPTPYAVLGRTAPHRHSPEPAQGAALQSAAHRAAQATPTSDPVPGDRRYS